jgi:UDP-N-acetylmuramate--alanine ligase
VIVPLPDRIPDAAGLGRVHFVGIGGAGMSGIARILLARGRPVSGSDAKDSRELVALRALGATCAVGHAAANVGDADTVVVSTAIRESNPEVVEARRRGLLILPRAAALAAVMVGRRGVAVAGTHGKTTTTSMLTVALQACGADPSFAIGGNLTESGMNAHDGSGSIFVAEADESDGSFLAYAPEVAVVTNVEADHLDNYGTPQRYAAAFTDFVARIRPGGTLVACADDPGARALAAAARDAGTAAVTYGEAADADVRVTNLELAGRRARFALVATGRRVGEVVLQVPGRHNALNATAAYAAGVRLGLPEALLREGLAGFAGTRRRFEAKGVANGVRVVDDYAHHPTELRAALAAAREVVGQGRVVVVFQPHLFSRTRTFATEFGGALGAADHVIVMDVYAAREDPVPGVTGALVAAAVPLPPEDVEFEPSWSAVPARAVAATTPGDLLLTVGAGDVTLVGPEVLALLAERAGSPGPPIGSAAPTDDEQGGAS